ncbi:hypothetical protein C8J57DRAFT_1714604 [Mycena rebaudengoi]|nr:hypothetical protein C8J57DRAFT_1714604 [Mycena rebaudengoi]
MACAARPTRPPPHPPQPPSRLGLISLVTRAARFRPARQLPRPCRLAASPRTHGGANVPVRARSMIFLRHPYSPPPRIAFTTISLAATLITSAHHEDPALVRRECAMSSAFTSTWANLASRSVQPEISGVITIDYELPRSPRTRTRSSSPLLVPGGAVLAACPFAPRGPPLPARAYLRPAGFVPRRPAIAVLPFVSTGGAPAEGSVITFGVQFGRGSAEYLGISAPPLLSRPAGARALLLQHCATRGDADACAACFCLAGFVPAPLPYSGPLERLPMNVVHAIVVHTQAKLKQIEKSD